MDWNLESILFWPFAIGLVASALAVILLRNPVSAALCLVLTIVFMAALFILLQAYYLAAIQILVYAGAVMVLFLFIIMLLDIKADQIKATTPINLIAGAVLILLSLIIGYKLFSTPDSWRPYLNLTLADPSTSSIKEISLGLFQKYMLPFQIIGLLLLVAAMGVVMICKKSESQTNHS